MSLIRRLSIAAIASSVSVGGQAQRGSQQGAQGEGFQLRNPFLGDDLRRQLQQVVEDDHVAAVGGAEPLDQPALADPDLPGDELKPGNRLEADVAADYDGIDRHDRHPVAGRHLAHEGGADLYVAADENRPPFAILGGVVGDPDGEGVHPPRGPCSGERKPLRGFPCMVS